MDKYIPPKPIELTDVEAALWRQIDEYDRMDHPPHDDWPVIESAMEQLVHSLFSREAVPAVRVALFTDPDLAITGSKSPQQIFESNGTVGDDIFRHPHFIAYLRHFIHGPDLPESAILGLCKILNDDCGTSGMVLDQYRKHARASTRTHGLDKHHAATEFYRLGIEIGMEQHAAKSLRDAAKSTR